MLPLRSLLVGLALAAVVAAPALADPIVVSSKIDTEGNLLGNVILQALQAKGLPVTNKVSLGSTPIVRKAITSGEIDIYPEYTGNAAFFFNKADDPVWKDAARGYEEAKKLDYDANKIVWLTPPRPTTPGRSRSGRGRLGEQGQDPRRLRQMGVGRRQGQARRLVRVRQQRRGAAGVREGLRLSRSSPTSFSCCRAATPPPPSRPRPKRPTASTPPWSTARTARSAPPGSWCSTTTRRVQPVYAPTPIVREAVLKAHPEIAAALKPVFASLDLKTLQTLNGRIQVNGESAKDVAADYLKSKGFVK